MQKVKIKPIIWLLSVGLVWGVIAALVVFFPSIRKDVVFSQQKKLSAAEYLQQGVEAEAKKDLAQAIWSFRQVLEMQKDDRIALERLPRLCILTGQLNQAVEYAQRLTEVSPRSPAGFFYLGMAYGLLGQHDKAAENYKKAVVVDPQYAEAYFNLGFLSESNGRLSEAIDYYRKALESDPKHAKAAYNLGNAYAGLARNQEAIGSYKIAITNDPNYTDAFVNLSILLTQAEDYDEAIKYLDEARILGYDAPEEYLKALEPYREGS